MGWSGTALSLAVIGGATATARHGVPVWDAALFRSVNGLPDALAPIVWGPMQVGALASPLVIAGWLAGRGRRPEAGLVAATGVSAWAIAKGVKRAVARGRPGDHLDGVQLRVGSADHGLGYPSGHAAVAVTIATALGRARPPWRLALLAIAGVVGLSRIYVGAHYPLDVVGGWALGFLVAGVSEPFGARFDSAAAS